MDEKERERRAREIEVDRVAYIAEQDFKSRDKRKCEWCRGKGTLPPVTTPEGVFLTNGGFCDYCVGTGRRLTERERRDAVEARRVETPKGKIEFAKRGPNLDG